MIDRNYCEDLHSMAEMALSFSEARRDWESRLKDKSSDYVCPKCFQITSTKNMHPAHREEFTKYAFPASKIFAKHPQAEKEDEKGVTVYGSPDYKIFLNAVSYFADYHVDPAHTVAIQQEILNYKRLSTYKFFSKNLFTRRDRPCTCHHCQKKITITGDPFKSQACFLFAHNDKQLFEDYLKTRKFKKMWSRFTKDVKHYQNSYSESIDEATKLIKESMKRDFSLKGKTKITELKTYLKSLKNTLSKEIIKKVSHAMTSLGQEAQEGFLRHL